MQKYPKVALLAPITHNIPPIGYGPWELVVFNLAEELVRLGVDVTIFATQQTKSKAKVKAIIEKPLKEYDQNDFQLLTDKHIAYMFDHAKNFDIIHNHLNIHPVTFAKNISTPMLTTLHGSAIERKNADYYTDVQDAAFISISNAERKFMPQLNYLDTVYNGVDFSLYPIRQNIGEYFVFSGRIVKEKGILSAIKLSLKTNIPLKIAGIITDQDFFDNEVKPYINNKLISFLGNLPYKTLTSLLKNALATLALIEWDEPFGLSVLDSLACGVPVIATKRGALPELIYDKQMGCIISSIDEAVEQIAFIKTINSNVCRELAEKKFSRTIMAKNYLKNYTKLLS